MKKYNFNKITGIDYLIPVIFTLLLTTVFLLPQLVSKVGISEPDTIFHFGRFYDTAQQLKNHNFSYFQMNYGMGTNGRIVNAFYGPFFAYFLGGLVLISKSWFQFEIMLVYLLFLIGGIGMYRLSLKLKMSRITSLLVTTIFLLTGYICYWARSTSFQAWGAALMPYILMQGLSLYNDRIKHFNWISLGITVAVLAQVHMLGTFFAILSLIPFFIYGLINTKDKKKMWRDAFKAVVLCLCLTANVWGAYLTLYPSNLISAPLGFSPSSTAVHLLWFGEITTWVKIQEVVLVLFGLQTVYILLNFKQERLNTFLTIEGLVFLFLSSDFFPWAYLENNFSFVNNYFQFPNRLTIVAFPLLFSGIGLTISHIHKNSGFKMGVLANCLLAFVIIFVFRADLRENMRKVSDSQGNIALVQQMRDRNLSNYLENNYPNNPDYLPLQKKMLAWSVSGLIEKYLGKDSDNDYKKEVLSGGKLQLSWNSDNTEKRSLPLVMYKQSELIVNGKKVTPKVNEIGLPEVSSKRGRNQAILSFNTPILFKILFGLTMMSWAAVIIIGVKYYCNRIKKRRV